MFRTILVASDGSWMAECAARVAVGLAQSNGGRLVALSVAHPAVAKPGGMETQADLDAVFACAHQDAIDRAARVAGFAHEAGVPCQAVTAISAFPGDEIIHAAEQNGCDLIVLGAYGACPCRWRRPASTRLCAGPGPDVARRRPPGERAVTG